MKLYTPKEVADMFGITPDALKGRRKRGQIEGIVMSDRSVVYTQEQVDKADLSPRKRGPKTKAKSAEPAKPVRKRKKVDPVPNQQETESDTWWKKEA